ncbi:diadenylate cyclase [Clostridium collagenovorans DSM 3089]|uniref:DNA integrity scanning protein DisA n=1 Tax=Clostridium collagenovorans DSM 3089 TaxID=1121306 RepID=A0A1M5YKZ0_9CLOT|nr:DNA integrity scanning diadenylate cyclase DisA [Clostridium collagenovorans]SHI12651.1 diadenylate cyclase [Clostridium collagenovorans DSM 3089]
MRIKKNDSIKDILTMMAPGTPLREGLENILKAKTGGLILISKADKALSLVDGGFNINAEYSPAYVYELAKMDGAIVITSDLKRILYANTQLMPEQSIATFETGTRHRTAQRVAKQTDSVVIAISQRRNMITVYKSDVKYVLRDTSVVLAKANQAIQTLEKYVSVSERVMRTLNLLEFQDLVTLFDVVTGIQRMEMVMKIVDEIDLYLCEAGNEGRLVSMQLDELVKNIEQEGVFLIRDYCKSDLSYEDIYNQLQNMDSKEILELDNISKILGYPNAPLVDTLISPRGYRMLDKLPRIPSSVIENLVHHFGELKAMTEASCDELDNVEGIGEARAKAIKSGLRRLKEQFILDR